MLDFLMGASTPMGEWYMWKWGFEHPYLFTLIKVAQPTLVAVGMVVAGKILFAMLFRKKDKNTY